jgi:tripartite-type tricarboxylate transporter receptor subunit TctC
MNRRHFGINASSLLGMSLASRVHAQGSAEPRTPESFPERLIKLVVPYPAGGVVDLVARTIAEPMSAQMPQRVLVENRPGADGRIGLDAVAKAAADGYTLLASTPLLATGEHLMPDMKGRAQDFAAVYGVAAPISVFVVPSSLPVRSIKELVALAISKPGELNVANPGTGSSHHLAQEMLFDLTGAKLTNIAYKGQPPSLADLAQGVTHFAMISQNLALALIRSGKLRALAVNAAKRTRSLPEVPTIMEAGYPGALVQSWYGLSAPAKTPPAIVHYLSEQCKRALALPETRLKFEGMDAEILDLPAARYQALIDTEFIRWGELIRKRKIQAS